MNSSTNIRALVGGAAVITAVVGLTAGLAPASAAPQQSPGVSLTKVFVDPDNSSNYILRVEGKFPMSEGAAYDRLRNMSPGGGIEYTVYADDPGEGDQIITSPGFIGAPGPPGGALIATSAGIAFLREFSVPTSKLNEDDGTDEIYVRVRFVQGNGAGDLRANTGSWSWDF